MAKTQAEKQYGENTDNTVINYLSIPGDCFTKRNDFVLIWVNDQIELCG